MKSKRLLSVLLVLCLTAAVAISNVSVVSAGRLSDCTRIAGVTYELEDVLAQLDLTELEGESTLRGGRTIRYRFEETEWKSATSSTIEFTRVGDYELEIYDSTSADPDADEADHTYYIYVKESVDAADADYNKTSITYDLEKVAEYQAEVDNAAKNLKTGGTFDVPSLEKYVKSKDFSYNTVQKTVYYCTPDQLSFSQGSSVKDTTATIAANKIGTYGFYVLFEDCSGNHMTTDTLVLGDGGWYKTVDNDGKTATGEVVIPVFSFNVKESNPPEVTQKVNNNAYLGLKYEIEAFNIVATDYRAEYSLFFSKDGNFDKDDYENDGEYMRAVLAAATEITEDETYVSGGYIDLDALTFTPQETGYYYVRLRIVDSYNNEDVLMSRPIACKGEAQSVVKEKEFFKNNVVSIIFLAIAGVCLVAIVILLFVKPKEAATVEVADEGAADEKSKK